MSKFIMKIVCYFKKHFVTRIRNFVFTYRKSIERKCPVTSIEKLTKGTVLRKCTEKTYKRYGMIPELCIFPDF